MIGEALDWPTLRAERTLAETDEYLVLDKPAGVSVAGERHETDLVRIAADAGEKLIPVHRIDKVTSGVVLLAKTTAAHGPLTRQFTLRTVDKTYLAITRSTGLPPAGTIDLPLSVGRKNRVRIAAPRDDITYHPDAARWSVPPPSIRPRAFPSLTTFTRAWHGAAHTLLVVSPSTGRRHQIRVHLAWIGHPIAGDPLFPDDSHAPDQRTSLHAWQLAFDDAAGARIHVTAAPDEQFWAPITPELPVDGRAEVLRRP
ncbi:RluA family pseudouridine synthase [Pseudonocardia acaciae]|uniref:RluA family pseudouridine synthase n=1 Tax=Pseudonocardia acaciae TaxID=551276 RepID=UPI000491FFE8|nr:RNA pseudouridine synthase [Pseudonocardia acaciae]